MSKLTFEYNEDGKDKISAFAFNTGHLIEELIKQETNNLIERNIITEAKILGFYQKLEEPIKSQYGEYFRIVEHTSGKL